MNDSNTQYGKEQDEWDRDYVKIHKVIIESVWIDDKDKIEYNLKGFYDRESWGDSVPENHIHLTFKSAYKELIKLWKLN